MPCPFFPEGNQLLATDGEWRTTMKWAYGLYDSVGQLSMWEFPEGTLPLVSDDEERLEKKILRMLAG